MATTPLPSLGAGVPANGPPFQYTAVADLSERYTTNALGTPNSHSSDYDTRAQLSLNAIEDSPNINANFNYSGTGDYFARDSTRPIFSNYLASKGIFSVLPDHFLLSAQLFAQPVYQSQLGNVAPIGEVLPPGANNDFNNSYGFAIQPDLFFRLGDVLRSDLIPAYSGVYLDQPRSGTATPLPAGFLSVTGSEFSKSLMERITSGSDFTRLQWGAIASYTEMDQSSGGLAQRSATGQLSYAIMQGLSFVANGGYQTVKANTVLIKPSSGPVILGGLNFDLPRLKGEFRVGEQYRSFSGVGHLLYQITPHMSFVAAATDNITTPLGSLLDQSSLLQSTVAALGSGQVSLPASSGPFNGALLNGALLNVGLQNEVARIRTATTSLNYVFENFTATIAGFGTMQSALTACWERTKPKPAVAWC